MKRDTLRVVICLLIPSGFSAPAAFGSVTLGHALNADYVDGSDEPIVGQVIAVGCDLGAGGICLLPADVGPCDGICPRFFHNPCTGQCEPFTYGCCDGNANNFETLEACEAACVVGPGAPIPAASAWGIVVMALLLVICGKLIYRRMA